MNIQVDKRKRTPVYLQISEAVKERIRSGELPDGSILPSERVMAQMLGVHRNTVTKAYGELKADGMLHSRQGSGYTVAVPLSAPAAVVARGKRVNWVNQIKSRHLDMDTFFDDLFERADGEARCSMGAGIAQYGVYDRQRLAHDTAELLLTKDTDKGFFSPYKGDRELRQKLVSFLSMKGIRASVGEIQVLCETNQAVGFLVLLLVKPGDVVLTEEPVSPDVYRVVELAGGSVCGVPMDENGVDCDVLEELVRRKNPRFLYLNSSFHDPTGIVLAPERRKRVIEISNTYRVPVIEEDAASELVYDGAGITPLKALDTLGNVIYIYSFSLTFVPGMSLAFVTAGKHIVESLSYLASVNMAAPDWITQKLAARYLEDGTYYAQLGAFRDCYRRKRDLVCRRLDAMAPLGVRYRKPRGGVYIWCRLPGGIDSKLFAARAYSGGATVFPGHLFYLSKKEGRSYIRINYSHESEERLERGMDILEQTLRELQDIPSLPMAGQGESFI
ncbi:MAG: PLP-dependent aminotransferase family protein [Ruminococcaceae bacterium]|jgi:DNA-binding transcriptional MocR family regulator|nr:PLP-dependent aminotransferase family protein [Oscillospiraceae bacterium]